jgi:hypothetical protein
MTFSCGLIARVVKDDGNSVVCIEGNTLPGNNGANQKGAGVWERTRHKSLILGYCRIRVYEPSNSDPFVGPTGKAGTEADNIKSTEKLGQFVNDLKGSISWLNASILAMHKAIKQLEYRPDFLLIDGNRFHPYPSIPHETIVKGDAKFQSIAAASILAKTHRDYLMKCLHQEYSGYDWQTNKGYPTLKHRNAIKSLGISINHRKTFHLIAKNSQLNLFN